MDDTAQKPKDQAPVVQPSAGTLTDDVQKISSQTKVTSAGRAQKEAEPVINSEPIIIRSDLEQEPNLHPEVAKAGVKVVRDKLELDDSNKAAGIEPAGVSVPVSTEPTGVVKPPLTEDQAEQVINTQKHDSAIAEHTEGIYRTNSIYGLAILVKKIFKEIHERLISQKA